MITFDNWKKEKRYIKVILENYKIVNVSKHDSVSKDLSCTGYFWEHIAQSCSSTVYFDMKKHRAHKKFLEITYEFDKNAYNIRCRKDKLNKINDNTLLYK